MSDAETLRRAAALMRERAEAAGPPARPRWVAWEARATAEYHVGILGRGWNGHIASPSRAPDDYGRGLATHIASWHPAVALAVADLLDEIALRWEYVEERELALAVANAYLQESP